MKKEDLMYLFMYIAGVEVGLTGVLTSEQRQKVEKLVVEFFALNSQVHGQERESLSQSIENVYKEIMSELFTKTEM